MLNVQAWICWKTDGTELLSLAKGLGFGSVRCANYLNRQVAESDSCDLAASNFPLCPCHPYYIWGHFTFMSLPGVFHVLANTW
jgi:hypothetical protein